MTDLSQNLLTEQKTPLFERLISAIINAFLIAFLALIAVTSFFEPVLISGSSMMNTVLDGETVLIYKGYSQPRRGDIVVINVGDVNIIKRIAAVGGDKIGFVSESGTIYLYLDKGNGFEKQDEPYIKESMYFSSVIFKKLSVADSLDELITDGLYQTVEKDAFIALGDNRNVSKDSRYYGQFDFTSVLGKEIRIFKKDEKSFLKSMIDFIYSDKTPVNNN